MDIYEESKRLIVGDEFHVIKRDPINALFAGYDKVDSILRKIDIFLESNFTFLHSEGS